MRRALLLLSCLAWAAYGASLPEVRAVYLMPMANGLDQYLAMKLISSNVMQVVTDPKLADAVFTDHLGEAFEQRLADLYTEKKEKDDDEKQQDKFVRPSSFSRGKGNIFLVDVKTRTVVWSAFERSKTSTPDALNRTATRIVQRLKKK